MDSGLRQEETGVPGEKPAALGSQTIFNQITAETARKQESNPSHSGERYVHYH